MTKDKIKVIITNRQKDVAIPTGLRMLVRRCCTAALQMEKFQGAAEVSVSFVNNEQIKELNAQYRNKDIETDVLSFGQNFFIFFAKKLLFLFKSSSHISAGAGYNKIVPRYRSRSGGVQLYLPQKHTSNAKRDRETGPFLLSIVRCRHAKRYPPACRSGTSPPAADLPSLPKNPHRRGWRW